MKRRATRDFQRLFARVPVGPIYVVKELEEDEDFWSASLSLSRSRSLSLSLSRSLLRALSLASARSL